MMRLEGGPGGWKNYATWCVNEWVSQEESDYDALMDLVDDPNLDRHQKAASLKATVEEMNPLLNVPSLWGDLMAAVLEEVDWLEIIRNHEED